VWPVKLCAALALRQLTIPTAGRSYVVRCRGEGCDLSAIDRAGSRPRYTSRSLTYPLPSSRSSIRSNLRRLDAVIGGLHRTYRRRTSVTRSAWKHGLWLRARFRPRLPLPAIRVRPAANSRAVLVSPTISLCPRAVATPGRCRYAHRRTKKAAQLLGSLSHRRSTQQPRRVFPSTNLTTIAPCRRPVPRRPCRIARLPAWSDRPGLSRAGSTLQRPPGTRRRSFAFLMRRLSSRTRGWVSLG